jgi:hypothetical protein
LGKAEADAGSMELEAREVTREQKITMGEMRASGVRKLSAAIGGQAS